MRYRPYDSEKGVHQVSSTDVLAPATITIRREIANRGQRPALRGWAHGIMTLLALIGGTVLTTYAWMTHPWGQALGVNIYSLGVFTLFGVSAAYHLLHWRSQRTVQWWRRLDHATIAVFIASTYTPLSLIVFPPTTAALILSLSWAGALLAAVLNLVWISHPRWLDVIVYLTLGWMIAPLIPQLWTQTGPAVVWLLTAGGIIYTVGAFSYGLKWPGRNARYYGYHEHFHTATVVAAILHHVALWIVVACS